MFWICQQTIYDREINQKLSKTPEMDIFDVFIPLS